MAISGTGDLPVEQVQIVLAAAGAERGGVGLEFLDGSQFASHQPDKRIEPRSAAQQACTDDVGGVVAAHVERLVGEDAAQLVVAQSACADNYLVEERIGRGVVVREDERCTARDVEAIASPIDGMLPPELDDKYRLRRHLEHQPRET